MPEEHARSPLPQCGGQQLRAQQPLQRAEDGHRIQRRLSGHYHQQLHDLLAPLQPSRSAAVTAAWAGIALETVDGGILDRVAISNITVQGVSTPIFLRLGNRARPFTENGPKPEVGALRNVLLSNIVATGASNVGCSITGVPGHRGGKRLALTTFKSPSTAAAKRACRQHRAGVRGTATRTRRCSACFRPMGSIAATYAG